MAVHIVLPNFKFKPKILPLISKFRQKKQLQNTYSCDPLLLVLLSSSGAISVPTGPVSGLGGLLGSGGGTRNDARRPITGVPVTVLSPGTAYTS